MKGQSMLRLRLPTLYQAFSLKHANASGFELILGIQALTICGLGFSNVQYSGRGRAPM